MSLPQKLLISGGYVNFITNNVVGLGGGEKKLQDSILNQAMSVNHLPQPCCPGTRTDVLKQLLRWIDGNDPTQKALWLLGGAASGKSAIARTIIELCANNTSLKGAIVFLFPRASQHTWGHLVPTIACQIAAYIPKYLEILQQIAHSTLRGIVDMPVQEQIQRLISGPLSDILSSDQLPSLPRLIIIDGLDELSIPDASFRAGPDHGQQHVDIITMLLTLTQQSWFPFQLLITSRHPSWLNNARLTSGLFSSPNLNTIILEDFDARRDIRTFFEAMIQSMKAAEGPQIFSQKGQSDWDGTFDTLVARTGGHFGHAASFHHFMNSSSITTLPDQRLQALLNFPHHRISHSNLEGNPFRDVDALFASILKASRFKTDMVVLLFAYYILPHSPRRNGQRLTINEIEQFHNFRCKSLLQGLLPLVKIVDGRIELLYPCIAEYLLDKSRSEEFHVDPGTQYSNMAMTSLRHISCSKVTAAGTPHIKDSVYALACESLKNLINHASLSRLSEAFESIDLSHMQRSRPTGLDTLFAFDTLLSCAGHFSAQTTTTKLDNFIYRQYDKYISSTRLAAGVDMVLCSEFIERSGVTDHNLILRVILPEDTQEYQYDSTHLKLRQLLLFGRRCFPKYLAFVRRSFRRLMLQRSNISGQAQSYTELSIDGAVHTRHAQLLIDHISRLRPHVQHQIQSDSSLVAYCLRCLPAVLSKAEHTEKLFMTLKPENRPWKGLSPAAFPPNIVQTVDAAADLYIRQRC
ncbi:hypothetical protein CVT24_006584 [Panaeolus cyanescens]|uniref:Nephrocystin 3-like N-terminal domain-containing protein n=1 Tax=Panaeolus cyanescens TaxID=181874 RepID=A0A409WCC8_9AGAR|nr:hypothetical protein CVT24_006584 [Panaeolus cyanescens]